MNERLEDAQLDSLLKAPWGTARASYSMPFEYAVALGLVPGVRHVLLGSDPDMLTLRENESALLIESTYNRLLTTDGEVKLPYLDAPLRFNGVMDLMFPQGVESAEARFLVFDLSTLPKK